MNDRELLELAARAAGMLDYNRETGQMVWRAKPVMTSEDKRWNSRYANSVAGTIDDRGYIRILVQIGVKKRKIRAHQLAWFIVTGSLPVGEIDHINQDKQDNRFINLRDVPKSINQRNGTRKRNNTSGIPGVTWHKQRQKWCAQASVNGKHYHLGLFAKIEDAERATLQFRAENGFTKTHGRAAAENGKSMGGGE
ncbi:TPA: HNH endonuclease [Pseudomonas aeruginosa]|nr:HNH endonuclease [Pseudomonas aeruginosa]